MPLKKILESSASSQGQKRRKRVITEARKLQNREAQRAYRQRQKDLLQKQRAQQKSRNVSKYRELRPSNRALDQAMSTSTSTTTIEPELCKVDDVQLDNVPIYPLVLPCVEFHHRNKNSNKELSTSTTLYLPDPSINNLQLSHTSLLTACLYNAQALGISVSEFFTYNCMSLCSPFYQPATSTSTSISISTTTSTIPAHLQPTPPQILYPHHPLFDLLPLPRFRARAIMLAVTFPAVVDALDLKKDIVEGGLVCRSRGGHPWELRSWEVAPWFLRKWGVLLSL